MKNSISRRTFVKGASAAALAVLAKLGGLIPEAKFLGLNEGPGVASAYAATYFGVAGWFCCGSAWGKCGTYPIGSCNDCSNDIYGCAFPKLDRPGYPLCDYTACSKPMQQTVCYQSLSVFNACSSSGVDVTVRSCGPNMGRFCGNRAPDCSPSVYYDRIIDLTQRAFSSIAPLDQGLVSAYVVFH